MHNKPIVKCLNCGSYDIIVNKHLCKCSECAKIFLISDKTRAFACSDYEKTFQDRYIQQYRGYNIYQYTDFKKELRFAFWYGVNDLYHKNSIETLGDCYELIDKAIDMKDL